MAAVLVDLTTAIVTTLETLSGSWGGEQFTVRRTYAEADEQLHEADSQGVVVDVVVPEDYDDVTLETRGTVLYTATVEVVIRKRIGFDLREQSGLASVDEMDSLLLLAETVGLASTYDRMAGSLEAAWKRTDHSPLYDRQHLRDLKQFTSVALLTFEITSAL